MTAILWILLPVLIAVGSALLAIRILQRLLELQLARERRALSEARATIEGHRETLQELDRLRRQAAQRPLLDDPLAGLRTEQRRFFRDQKMLLVSRKTLVIQEHDVPVEEGVNLEEVARNLSVFNSSYLKMPSPLPRTGRP